MNTKIDKVNYKVVIRSISPNFISYLFLKLVVFVALGHSLMVLKLISIFHNLLIFILVIRNKVSSFYLLIDASQILGRISVFSNLSMILQVLNLDSYSIVEK